MAALHWFACTLDEWLYNGSVGMLRAILALLGA